MENRRENKVSMFRKVETFLALRATELAPVAAIADAQLQLSNNLEAILDNAVNTGADLTGFTETKRVARKALEDSIYIVAGAGSIYYTKISPDLGNRKILTFSRSDLERQRDTDLYVTGVRVKDLTTGISTLLVPYGITATDYTNFETRLTAYYDSLQLPRSKQGESSAALKQMERLIAETDTLLDKELDVLMRYFKVNNATIYDEYLVARAIDDTGSQLSVLTSIEGNISAAAFLNLGLLPGNANIIRLINSSNAVLEIGLSNDGTAFNGNTSTLSGNGTIEVSIEELNSTGSTVLLRNQSTSITGSYKVQVLG